MESIVVLGSTGSIGSNTLDILSRMKNRYKLLGISFNNNTKKAIKQIEMYKPIFVCCGKNADINLLKNKFKNIRFLQGEEGIVEMISMKDVDFVVNALVGTSGLLPTYYTLKNKKKLALANKESLVIAGKIFSDMAKENSIEIIPIDSEHSAIYQCLEGRKGEDVDSIIITASGGPFLHRENFENITLEDALNHPNWSMGNKITIDSATMMNKGFEIIEAKWLFNVGYDRIKVVVHKESILHSAVEFADGSIMAQLGAHDMRIPISYALSKPRRLNLEFKINLADIAALHFENPDFERFSTLNLAYGALKKEDKNLSLILNAADEVAVSYFLNKKIKFTDIFKILKYSYAKFENNLNSDIFALKEETKKIKKEVSLLIKKEIGG